MADPVVVAHTAIERDTDGTLVLTTPTGAASGWLLRAFLMVDNLAADITAADGAWNRDRHDTDGSTRVASFTLNLSGAAAANYTFNSSNVTPGDFKGCIVAVNPNGNTYNTQTIDRAATTGSATIATPAVTAYGNPSVVIAAFFDDSNHTVSSPPADMTQTVAPNTTSSSTLAVYHHINPTDNPTYTRSLTFSGTEELQAIIYSLDFDAAGGEVTETVVLDPIEITLDVGGTIGIAVELAPIEIAVEPQGVTANGGNVQTVTLTPIGIELDARAMTVEVVQVPSEATGSRASISIGISL